MLTTEKKFKTGLDAMRGLPDIGEISPAEVLHAFLVQPPLNSPFFQPGDKCNCQITFTVTCMNKIRYTMTYRGVLVPCLPTIIIHSG